MSRIPPSFCRAVGNTICSLAILTILPVAVVVLTVLSNEPVMVAGLLLGILVTVALALVPFESLKYSLATLFILTGITAWAIFSITTDGPTLDRAREASDWLSNAEAVALSVDMGHTVVGLIIFLVAVALLAYLASARFGYWPAVIAGSLGVALGLSGAQYLTKLAFEGEFGRQWMPNTALVAVMVSVTYGTSSLMIPALLARRIIRSSERPTASTGSTRAGDGSV